MGKRLVLCCDGTWSTPDQRQGSTSTPTNVTKLAMAVAAEADGVRQLVYYQPGVGTAARERLRGGAFGWGLSRGVTDVYRHVVDHYEPGDELFFFGFSRGAYMARSAVGLINNAGILRRENAHRVDEAFALYRDRAVKPRDVQSELFRRSFSHPVAPIRFIGVWDTVGALGIPLGRNPLTALLNRRWQFHDVALSRSVQAAYHALAIDESSRPFTPTLWEQAHDAGEQELEQVWFAGGHSDIGGGLAGTGLSDVALAWMAERARGCGLVFESGAFDWPSLDGGTAAGAADFAPDPAGRLHDSTAGVSRILGRAARAIGQHTGGREAVSSTVLFRRAEDASYRPRRLDDYLSSADHRIVQVGPWQAAGGAGA